MADKIYSVNQESPQSIVGFESFNSQDVSLINSFEVSTLFNPDKNFMELHVVSLIDEVLESDYNYIRYKQLGNAQSAGKSGASTITLDPVADVKRYGYENGSVKLLYHFLNDLFSETKSPVEFFIDSISEDRTELRLQTLQLTTEQVLQRVSEIKSKLQEQSYFSEFRLNFKNNDLCIGINIDTIDVGLDKFVTVKLYESLPVQYTVKSKLTIVELVADSVAYEVDYEIIEQEPENFPLKPANFNLEITDDHTVPTGYFNYEELFTYPVNNSNSQIYTMINQKGVELSIDHTDYKNFIHFSSAQERLLNFKYKLDLISSSYANINTISSATLGLTGVTGSQSYYNGIIEGIVNNFDHYERFLYYESGSHSWPKSNSTKPYINQPSTTVEAVDWFTNQLTTAVAYDLTNYNSVLSTVPSYIKDDSSNEAYLTFLFMVGQHFDTLWIYAKAVSDKYDADNRLEHGIPRDLVSEALKNFGVKLYTSNKSIEELFTTITGQAYQSGSELINTYITGSITGSNISIQPTSYDGYIKEVQKRIYHNLPLLLKSKGTERGLRALINCFGIPSETLQIKLYGGQSTSGRPFYGDSLHYTSSLDKLRLDNTGSLITGSTLSRYVSTVKQETKYTDDIHIIEVGFSPTDNVNTYIVSKSADTFDLDEYLGDPRNLYNTEYAILNSSGSINQSLSQLSDQIVSGLSAYDVFDYIRLIKFFDNTIFKMVKDFIPARSVADTGIILKPHILHRSKIKSPAITGLQPEYTGSIETTFIESGNGKTFGILDNYDTSYTELVQSPDGLTVSLAHTHQQPKYNGEFSGSNITVTNGNLNLGNIFTTVGASQYVYTLNFVSASNEICILDPKPGIGNPFYITSSTQQFNATDFFINTNASSIYSSSSPLDLGSLVPITFPIVFNQYSQNSPITLKASNTSYTFGDCSDTVSLFYGTCSLGLTQTGRDVMTVSSNVSTQISRWFETGSDNTVEYNVTYNGVSSIIASSPGSTSYTFTQPVGSEVTITVNDPNLGGYCKLSKTVIIAGQCSIGLISTGSAKGLEFRYSNFTVSPRSVFIGDNGETVPLDYQHEIINGNEGVTYTGNVNISPVTPVYSTVSARGIKQFSDWLFEDVIYTQIQQLTTTYNFIGITEGSTASTEKARGLQGYFTPPYSSSPSSYIIPYDDTYYNIYALKNSSRTGYYDLNTYGMNQNRHTWLQQQDSDYYETNFAIQMQEYFLWWKKRKTPPYESVTTYPGSYPITGFDNVGRPLPIGIVAPFKNYLQGNVFTPSTVLYTDPTTIIRALVIEAYKENQPECRQIITVYGERSTLYSMNPSIEGPGTIPHFTERWIALGYDYSVTTPVEEPALTSPGGDLYNLSITSPGTRYYQHTNGRIYIKVPIRSYSTT